MESIESSPPAHFVWKVTGEPVQIGLSLDVVRRIREYLAPDSKLRQGQDKGGLLLGNSNSQGVQIDNFVPLLADENGLRYVHPRFGPRDLKNYIEELNFLAGPAAVVGYFRGDFGKGVRLFETDLAFIDKYFPDRSNVFLVVRTTSGAPPSAGFFFWENGDIFTSCSFREFVFDERVLAAPYEPAPSAEAPAPILTRVRAINAGVAVTIGLLAGAYLLRPVPKGTGSGESRPVIKTGLAVSGSGKEVNLVWNGAAPVIAAAKAGLLTIKDSGAPGEVALTPAQLRSGTFKYTVRDDIVEITLEVFARDGGVIRESVTVISRAGAPPSVQAPVSPPPSEIPSEPEKPREPVRSFVPPPAPPKAAPAAVPGPDHLEPAPVAPPVARLEMPRVDAPAGNFPSAPAAAPPKPAPPVEPVKAAEPPAVPLPVRRPPIPVRQVRPSLPPNVQGMLSARSTIQVRVQVDAGGKVTAAAPVAAPGSIGKFLGAAAANAAKLWTFEPALEGAKKVPGELVIEFTFGPVK